MTSRSTSIKNYVLVLKSTDYKMEVGCRRLIKQLKLILKSNKVQLKM